jgi:hypothetical protein
MMIVRPSKYGTGRVLLWTGKPGISD